MNRRNFLKYSLLYGAALLVPEPLVKIARPLAEPLGLYRGRVIEITEGFTLDIHRPEPFSYYKTVVLSVYGEKNRWMSWEFLNAAIELNEPLPFILIHGAEKFFGEFYLAAFDMDAPIYSFTSCSAVFQLSGALKKL